MNSEVEGDKGPARDAESVPEPDVPDSWCESESSGSEAERAMRLPQRREKKNRVSAKSRVNFSKLSAREKEQRCLNLAKQLRSLKKKNQRLHTKWRRLPAARDEHKGEQSGEQNRAGVVTFRRANERIATAGNFELPDQRRFLENLCTQIVDGRLPLDSMRF